MSPTSYLFNQKGILTLSAVDPAISPYAPSSSTSSSLASPSTSTPPTFDQLFDIALEHGAEDVREILDDTRPETGTRSWEIITALSDLVAITEAFSSPPHNAKWQVDSSERTFLPIDPLPVLVTPESGDMSGAQEDGITESNAELVERALDILENEREVVKVWTNLE